MPPLKAKLSIQKLLPFLISRATSIRRASVGQGRNKGSKKGIKKWASKRLSLSAWGRFVHRVLTGRGRESTRKICSCPR
ncbi:hypothetical protein PUN28_015877 [Cardiocondyla obscurior]|uniref:Uncharacterized protein n=1 Tax=Cardiocondyla obscurior TaxID=286306 RepID=A0AAW2ETG2_9HYME